MIRRIPALALVALALSGFAGAAETTPAAPIAPATASPDTTWFRQARFGLFIHWGIYSIPAGEYTDPKTGKVSTNHAEWFLETTKMPVSEYEKFLPQFNPVNFDADAWVCAAADAGVKYLCITAKHHDGFAMFPSAVTENWHFGLTPMGKTGRDPLMEIKHACEKYGVEFCLYHTILDWRSTDYAERRAYNDRPGMASPPDMGKFRDFVKASTAEVIRRYHPKMMWLDGSWERSWTPEYGRDLRAHLLREAPTMIVNDRVGPGAAGTGGLGKGELFGDYTTPEQFIPDAPLSGDRPWETCMTMNGHWGFNKADKNWKSPETLIRTLVEVASKGGNLLLNIGPDATGEIPAASLERLAAIGRWMKVNGESIYGTTATPFTEKFAWDHVTAKGDTLYLHVFKRPADGVIALPGDIKSARLLATGTRLSTATVVGNTPTGAPRLTRITLPETLPDAIDTVIVVKLAK